MVPTIPEVRHNRHKSSLPLLPPPRVLSVRPQSGWRFLSDLPLRWDGQRILVVGHAATRWGLEHVLNGKDLEELISLHLAGGLGSTGLSRSNFNRRQASRPEGRFPRPTV